MLALWTRRTSACTTSDIGGLNSGSGCTSKGLVHIARILMYTCTDFVVCGDWSSYLDTQSNNIGKTGEGFGGVKTLECRINHLVQGVNVMQLGSSPPDKWLLWSGPRTVMMLWNNSQVTRNHCMDQWVKAMLASSDDRHTCQMVYGLSRVPAWRLQSYRHHSWGYTDRTCPPLGHYIQNPDLKPADVPFWSKMNRTCRWDVVSIISDKLHLSSFQITR